MQMKCLEYTFSSIPILALWQFIAVEAFVAATMMIMMMIKLIIFPIPSGFPFASQSCTFILYVDVTSNLVVIKHLV